MSFVKKYNWEQPTKLKNNFYKFYFYDQFLFSIKNIFSYILMLKCMNFNRE